MTTETLDKPIKSAGYFTDGVGTVDPAVAAAMKHELEREQYQIELIASENIVSKAVLEAQGSVFTNKYAEGYPGRRYYQGCAPSDEVETLAIDRAKQLFDCGYANVQPHSGAQANGAVMLALTKPGFLKILYTDPAGRKMVATAIVMMIIGVFAMRRIIKIRV